MTAAGPRAPAGDVDLDVAIVGGGIAGLWLLDELHRAGYRVALFEAEALGGGQTVSSQGIIHSGAKYALGRRGGGNRARLTGMPDRWLASIAGKAAPDLSAAGVASPAQYLLLPRSLKAVLARIFGGAVLHEAFTPIRHDAWPVEVAGTGFRGTVIRLDEPVLDIPAVIRAFLAAHRPRIRLGRAEPDREQVQAPYAIQTSDGVVRADRIVAAAGAGNASLAPALAPAAKSQERPLRMVLLRGPLPRLWAHADIRGSRPSLTVTTHAAPAADQVVWYLGGDIAEIGVRLGDDDLITETRRRLTRLFPALSLNGVEWAVHDISRHESATADRHLPDGPVVRGNADASALVAWPTKLAYAPLMAQAVLEQLASPTGARPAAGPLPGSVPPLARPPWETADWRSLP